MEILLFQPDRAKRHSLPAPTHWRAMVLIAVLATGMSVVSAGAQDTQSGFQRQSGATTLPREFDWIAATGDSRIYPMLEQAFYLEEHKDYEAAIAKYKQMLDLGTLGKGVAPTSNSIAGCYQQLGNFAEEVNWAKRATDAAPEFPFGYLNLGNGYAGLGDRGRATRAFTKFVALRPEDAAGYYSLGLVADQQQDWSQANHFTRSRLRLTRTSRMATIIWRPLMRTNASLSSQLESFRKLSF